MITKEFTWIPSACNVDSVHRRMSVQSELVLLETFILRFIGDLLLSLQVQERCSGNLRPAPRYMQVLCLDPMEASISAHWIQTSMLYPQVEL